MPVASVRAARWRAGSATVRARSSRAAAEPGGGGGGGGWMDAAPVGYIEIGPDGARFQPIKTGPMTRPRRALRSAWARGASPVPPSCTGVSGQRQGAARRASSSWPRLLRAAGASGIAVASAMARGGDGRPAGEARTRVIDSGGISTTTSPSGRTIAPRARAASVTRWPMRSSSGNSASAIPDMRPQPADLDDHAERLDELVEQARPGGAIFGCSAPMVRSCLEDLQRRQRRGAGQRVAGVRVAVEEGLELLVLAEEAFVDALGGERRRERQVAACQALGDAEEVGRRRPPARRRTSCPSARSPWRPRRRSAARRGGRRDRARARR